MGWQKQWAFAVSAVGLAAVSVVTDVHRRDDKGVGHDAESVPRRGENAAPRVEISAWSEDAVPRPATRVTASGVAAQTGGDP